MYVALREGNLAMVMIIILKNKPLQLCKLQGFPLRVTSGTRTHDIQNHNLTL